MKTTTRLPIAIGALMLALAPASTLAQSAPTFVWRSAGNNAFLSHQRSAVVSPDGTTLYTASQDNTLKVYNVATGKLLRTMVGSGTSLQCIAISHDGKQVVAGGAIYLGLYGVMSAVADVWSTSDYHHIRSLQSAASAATDSTAMIFSPDDTTLAWATEAWSSSDSVFHAQIETHRVSDGSVLKTFIPAISQIDEMVYAKDGKTLVAVGENDVIIPTGQIDTPTAEIWDPVSAMRKTSIKTKLGYVQAVRFSPDGKQLALGGSGANMAQSAIELWNATGSTLKSTLVGTNNSVRSCAFTPDGKTLVGGGLISDANQNTYGTLETWNVATGKRTFAKQLPERSAITTIVSVNNGQGVIVESELGEVSQLSAANASVAIDYTHRIYGFSGVVASPNGHLTAYAESTTGAVRIADAATGVILRTYRVPSGEYVNTMAFSPDSSQVVIAQSNGLYAYGATANSTHQISKVSYGNVAFAAVKSLMVTSRSYTDPKTNQEEEIIEGWTPGTYQHVGQITAIFPSGYNLAVSADGTRVAMCGQIQGITNGATYYHGIVGIWNVADGKQLGSSDITSVPDSQLAATDLSFSPDGKSLAVSYGEDNRNNDVATGAVRLFDATNCHLKTTSVTTDYLYSVRCSADGTKLITCGYNRNANTGSATGSLTIRRTQDNAIVLNYVDDLGTGVNFFSLNEVQDLIVVTQMDSTISTLTYSGI